MSLPYLHPFLGLSNGLNTLHAAGGGAGGVGGWVELGRTTLGSGASSISVASLSDKRYYMVLLDNHGMASVGNNYMRLNNLSTGIYAERKSTNGGADTTVTSQTEMAIGGSSDTLPTFSVHYFANLSAKEKLSLSHMAITSASGAGTAPERIENYSKCVETSNPINRIDALTLSPNYNIGSELVVLGWDPSDTHTNNFWQELASVDTLTSGDIDSGVFTAKKYLWVQFETIVNTYNNTNTLLKFNSDASSNYSYRINQNGVSDITATGSSGIGLTYSGGKRTFGNMFIINNSSNEKLVICHENTIGTTANSTSEGAGIAPRRFEIVGKWITTGSQITRIILDDTVASLVSGQMKVWGSD